MITRRWRLMAAAGAAAAILTGLTSTAALATSAQPAHAVQPASHSRIDGPPTGCAPHEFCDWLNGGKICFNSPNSQPTWFTLHAPGSGTVCATNNNEEFNNGAAAGVRMYPLTNYRGGAWNCLGNGHYYLDNSTGKDTFTAGSGPLKGRSIYHDVESSGNGVACT